MTSEGKFEVFYTSETKITAPAVDQNQSVYVCSVEGNVLNLGLGSKTPEVLVETDGLPAGVVIDASGAAFVADVAARALLGFSAEEGVTKVVDNFDEKPLMGPTAVTTDDDDNIYFCDSGSEGDSNLGSPRGTVYAISGTERLLVPLISGLAHPSGVAVVGAGRAQVVYVAELYANRILRGVQRPAGVFHFSVFHAFSGGMGPAGVAVDPDGNVLVAHKDAAGISDSCGRIVVLSPRGKVTAEVEAPAPELSGICVSQTHVYVTEGCTVYRINRNDLA